MKITTVGIDIAKSVFHAIGINAMGSILMKKEVKRMNRMIFVAQIEACRIALEACGSAHYWVREFRKHGHDVKFIAPQYVKPFVTGNKNDDNDTTTIAETAQRPTMRFVPIKNQEQQDIQAVHRLRERGVKERAALVNQIRGLLAEYGIVIHQGVRAVRRAIPEILEDGENGLSGLSRECFAGLYDELTALDEKIASHEQKLADIERTHDICQRLDGIIGIGPITATAAIFPRG